MKKAFTMIELVFVIVVMGILAAVIIPNTRTNPLQEAAIQVVSHIRYTQHLAMVDDKFDLVDNIWFQRRWRFSFSNGAGSNGRWSYTIFADILGTASGNPNPTEVAVNPLNSSKRLTGGSSAAGDIQTGDDDATDEMNLGESYGVANVTFSAPCRTGVASKGLGFDHLGRPLRGGIQDYTSAYENNAIATNILVPLQCVITLTHDDGNNIQIAVEPETGYAHIL